MIWAEVSRSDIIDIILGRDDPGPSIRSILRKLYILSAQFRDCLSKRLIDHLEGQGQFVKCLHFAR